MELGVVPSQNNQQALQQCPHRRKDPERLLKLAESDSKLVWEPMLQKALVCLKKVLMCLGNLSSHVVVLKLITIQITE